MAKSAYVFDAIRTPRGKGKPGGGMYEVKPIDLVRNLLDVMKARHLLLPLEQLLIIPLLM